LNKEECKVLEPSVKCTAAILVEETGVINSAGFLNSLYSDCLSTQVTFSFESKVVEIQHLKPGFKVTIEEKDKTQFSFTSELVINAAGLGSENIAHLVGINDPDYKLHFCKGEYFSVINGKNKRINRLIYPIPEKNLSGLGIHATIDVNHGLKLGPNAIFLEDNVSDYTVDAEKKSDFLTSAQRFLPFLEENDLIVGEAGIRPKLSAENEEAKDFIIKDESDRGFNNFINLIGIESPGLTASLAIAKYVNKLINS
jgi:L-2-hydroxyglutarate oxidase LhgO